MTDLATRIADVKKKAEAEIIADKVMKAATEGEGYDVVQRKVLNWSEACKEYTIAASPDLFLAMVARIEELEKALEPFAKAADELIPGTPDEAGVMWDGIVAMANAGHLRTAARALKG
jgi:hypothetical protein